MKRFLKTAFPLGTLGRIGAAAAALAVLLTLATAHADDLVQHLSESLNVSLHNRGDVYLARLIEVTPAQGRGRATLTIELITQVGIPAEDFRKRTVTVNNILPQNLPMDKLVFVSVRFFGNNASVVPMGGDLRNRHYHFDRGVPGDRYYDLTARLLFSRPDQLDRDGFYKELLKLAADNDERIARLAASYIGSPINIYANAHCPAEVIEAVTTFVLDGDNSRRRDAMAPFFGLAGLPAEPQRILSLLATGSETLAGEVRERLSHEASRADQLAPALSESLRRPPAPALRENLLRATLAWGKKANPLWPAIEELLANPQAFDVSPNEQALAARGLIGIDPERAEEGIRAALPHLDDPDVYRYLYERQMADAVPLLIDKLRHNTTRHSETLRAALAAMTRTGDLGDRERWLAWWDALVEGGDAGTLIERRFVPTDDAAREINSLLEQLGDPNYPQRNQALTRLRAIGPLANPLIEKALGHTDPEVAIAADELLRLNKQSLASAVDALYRRPVEQDGNGAARHGGAPIIIEMPR